MKLALKQKQIIIGLVVVLVVVVAVVLGVFLSKNKNNEQKITPKTTPKTTLLPPQPDNNYIPVGLSSLIKFNDCHTIHDIKAMPLKNIVLNSKQQSFTRNPEIVFEMEGLEFTAYVIALIANRNNFGNSVYILSFPSQWQLNELRSRQLQGEKIITPNTNNTPYITSGYEYVNSSYTNTETGDKITHIKGTMILKELLNYNTINNKLNFCYSNRSSPEIKLRFYIRYRSDILDSISADLNMELV